MRRWLRCKAGLLEHESVRRTQASRLPADFVIKSTHDIALRSLRLIYKQAHTQISTLHFFCQIIFGRWEQVGVEKRSKGRVAGAFGKDGKSSLHTHDTHPSLTSSSATLNGTWRLVNFPKTKSNLRLSPLYWHRATVQRLKCHPSSAADWLHHTSHTHTKTSHSKEGKKLKV